MGYLVMTRVRVPFLPKKDILSQYSPPEDDFLGKVNEFLNDTVNTKMN